MSPPVLHRSLQLTERSPNKFAAAQQQQQLQQSHRTVVRLGPNDAVAAVDYPKQQMRSSPNRRRHRSPVDYADYDSSMGEDPYSKSRSFDEDYASGYKKSSKVVEPQAQQQPQSSSKRSYSNDRQQPGKPVQSANYGRRLYEHNLMGGQGEQNVLLPNSGNSANYRNRSPLMMDFRQEPGPNKRMVASRDRSPAAGVVQPEELNVNEQFYHLKKLLSNANLQNNMNYQYTKSKSANSKRNPLQSSESLIVGEHAHPEALKRSPMLSKRSESLQQQPVSSSSMFKGGRLMKADSTRKDRRQGGNGGGGGGPILVKGASLVSVMNPGGSSGAPAPTSISSGRY